MKKALKIAGISLAGLVGLIVVAVGVVLYVVLTPERVTPVVNKLAARYITCDVSIGRVEPTFFSTFPQLGVKVNDVSLVNADVATEAGCDTVASMSDLTAAVNIRRLLADKALQIDRLTLNGLNAHLLTNADGESNFLVFRTDTTEQEPDTAVFSLPFDDISLKDMSIRDAHVCYTNLQDTLSASLDGLTVGVETDLKGGTGACQASLKAKAVSASTAGLLAALDNLKFKADLGQLAITPLAAEGRLQLSAHIDQLAATAAQADTTDYLTNQSVSLDLPFAAQADGMSLSLHDASVSLDPFAIHMDGAAAKPADNIDLDLKLQASDWDINRLLALLPKGLVAALNDLKADGTVSHLSAHVYGSYGDSLMPQVEARVQVADATVEYAPLPYELRRVNADVAALVDLRNDSVSSISIHSLSAETRQTTLRASGTVSPVMSDQVLDIDVDADLNLPDADHFLPDNLVLQGRAKGKVHIGGKLDDWTNARLLKTRLNGQFTVSGLDLQMDSLTARASKAQVDLLLPNTRSLKSATNFLRADIKADDIDFAQGSNLAATGQKADLQVELSDVTTGRYLTAKADFDLNHLNARYDDINAELSTPKGSVTARLDQQNSEAMPRVVLALNADRVKAGMDTVKADLRTPDISLTLNPQAADPSQLQADIMLNTASLDASLGSTLHAATRRLKAKANIHEDKSEENALTHWNPKVNLVMSDGVVNYEGLDKTVKIPSINVDYDNAVFNIHESEIILGNSDFHLSGTLEDVGDYIAHEGFLSGDLNFTSDMTDVNELMDLFSGAGADSTMQADLAAAEATQTDGDPFIVPQNMNIVLHTDVKKALIANETAYDLGGNLYVQDGTVILEEIGFICEAARLQLTGIYRTPRRNHLYLGADIHLLDIHIAELLRMFPQVDTMLPMLRTFSGNAEFHMAVETYMNAKYELKTSTSIGAASIRGEQLELKDNETFAGIARKLLFKQEGKMVVDSISAEITLWNREIDIYPFLMSINNYQAAVGGRHNLDMTYDYHISLLKPLRIGVSAKTDTKKNKLRIGVEKAKYAEDFRPERKNVVQTQNMKLRDQIRAALKRTVRQ